MTPDDDFTTTHPVNPEGERMVPKSELDAITARAETAETVWKALNVAIGRSWSQLDGEARDAICAAQDIR